MTARAGRARRPAVHRHHRSRHGAARSSRRARGYRETFINPADIGGRFSALSLFGLVPAALIGAPVAPSARRRRGDGRGLPAGESRQRRARARRVHRRADALDGPRQADRRAAAVTGDARAVDRAAGRREHRQARQGRAAGRRRAARSRRTSTARIARSSRSRSESRRAGQAIGWRRSRRPAIPVLRLTHAARRPRRGVLPLGVRDGGRRRRARHQSVRRAERLGSEGEDQGAARRLREARPLRRRRRWPRHDDVAVDTRDSRGRHRRSRARRAASLKPGDYVAFLSYLPGDSERRVARCRNPAGDAAPHHAPRARSASGRATCTRPGSITRADRTRRRHSCSRRTIDTRDGDPGGGLFVLGAEARAGARRLRDAGGARPPRGAAARHRRRSGRRHRAGLRGRSEADASTPTCSSEPPSRIMRDLVNRTELPDRRAST